VAVEPLEYPPPVKPAEEFVTGITDPEEERIEVGVAIVGGGPAGLACAIKLMQLLENEPSHREAGRSSGCRDREGKVAVRTSFRGQHRPPAMKGSSRPDKSEAVGLSEVTKDATTC
jgi:electron-transferring-flavoprotein dehydrogenase